MWFLNKETNKKFYITDEEHLKIIKGLEHFEEIVEEKKEEKKEEPKKEEPKKETTKKRGRPSKKEGAK